MRHPPQRPSQRDAVQDAASGVANADDYEIECAGCGETFTMNGWILRETPREHQRCNNCKRRRP